MKNFSLFIVFLLAGWDCIQQFILRVDGAGRIPFWLSLLFLIVLVSSDKKARTILFSNPMSWQWGMCVYALLNTMRIGISLVLHQSDEIFFYQTATPFLLFAFVYLIGRTDRKRCLTAILCSMYMSCVIYMTQAGMGEWGGGVNAAMRLSSETLNSNYLSFYAVAAFFVLLCYYDKYGMKKSYFYAGSALSAIIMFLTVSRTGYISFFMLLAFAFVHKIKLTFAKATGCILLLVLLYFANSWIMDNTEIGYRFSMRTYESDRAVFVTDTILDDIFGERIIYIILLIDLFPDFPFCGVGTYNFILHNSLNNQVCHNEYIRQLTEGGLIGFGLFAAFMYFLIKQLVLLLKTDSVKRSALLLCAGGILCVLFAYVGSFTMPMMQIMLAVAASEIFAEKNDTLETKKVKKRRFFT